MTTTALFIPCFVDQLQPEVGLAMARVLRRIGCELQYSRDQTCCGQPAFNSGYWRDAKAVAERFVRIFSGADAIVCPSGSCVTMVRIFFPELLQDSPLRGEAVELGKRVFEFSEYLVNVRQVTDVGAVFPHRVTYHDACHALRELHIKQAPRILLAHVRGLTLIEMAHSEDCCGFGGTFATKFSMISGAMGRGKIENTEESGAEYLTSTDPSCLMHLDGVLRKRDSALRAIHLASILAHTNNDSAVAQTEKAASRVPAVR